MTPPLLELAGVGKRHGGGDRPVAEVLRGIDLAIRAGEFVAIVGPSGSGKSTLMYLLGCLDRPSSGSYRFAGHDVATLDADQLAWLRREAFGFVFQGYHLVPSETARENVELPAVYAGLAAAERQRRATGLLGRLGLGERGGHRPAQLSGGQQQRVSIARALMNGGRIILADEPTGALDRASGGEVLALLKELHGAGHTIVLITHDLEVAAHAPRVIEIRDGAITADSGGRESPRPLPPPDMARTAEPGAGSLLGGLGEALRSAWRVMRAQRLRTALTLLGIVIGVASVIVMFAIGEGARRKVLAELGSLGTATLYVSGSTPADGGPPGRISLDDLAAIEALPQVRRAMPVVGGESLLRHGNVSQSVWVTATTEAMPLIHRWAVAQGRFHHAAEDAALAPVVVLGSERLALLMPGVADPIGRQILIGDAPFEVIGVMTAQGADSAGGSKDDDVFVPYRTAMSRVMQHEHPQHLVVEAPSSEAVDATERAIRQLLLARHGGREDFAIGNAAAQLNVEMAAQRSMTLMLGLIAAVSLVVGGIGVMNVMLMAVKERTREIGIRLAVGARQRDIFSQFITESMLVSLAGGVAGLLLGTAATGGLGLAGVPIGLSAWAASLAFACALATGFLSGFMPARQAARLDPVVALAGD